MKTYIGSFVCFSFRVPNTFSPIECPGLYQHRPGQSLGKNKVLCTRNEKLKKFMWVFMFQNMANF